MILRRIIRFQSFEKDENLLDELFLHGYDRKVNDEKLKCINI